MKYLLLFASFWVAFFLAQDITTTLLQGS